jgi:hypothetical protein
MVVPPFGRRRRFFHFLQSLQLHLAEFRQTGGHDFCKDAISSRAEMAQAGFNFMEKCRHE